jgi:hypothetical protein
MKAWRALLVLTLVVLGGCLVTFENPIPPEQSAPLPLLGEWSGEDEWGEQRFLDIRLSGSNLYRAVSTKDNPDNPQGREEIAFTVAQHGRRWYLCAGVPKKLGANFAIAGFELTRDNELVIYNLDVERILAELDVGTLEGRRVSLPEDDGVLISSPLEKVFEYLDDPANSGVFIEAARYQRVID